MGRRSKADKENKLKWDAQNKNTTPFFLIKQLEFVSIILVGVSIPYYLISYICKHEPNVFCNEGIPSSSPSPTTPIELLPAWNRNNFLVETLKNM